MWLWRLANIQRPCNYHGWWCTLFSPLQLLALEESCNHVLKDIYQSFIIAQITFTMMHFRTMAFLSCSYSLRAYACFRGCQLIRWFHSLRRPRISTKPAFFSHNGNKSGDDTEQQYWNNVHWFRVAFPSCAACTEECFQSYALHVFYCWIIVFFALQFVHIVSVVLRFWCTLNGCAITMFLCWHFWQCVEMNGHSHYSIFVFIWCIFGNVGVTTRTKWWQRKVEKKWSTKVKTTATTAHWNQMQPWTWIIHT